MTSNVQSTDFDQRRLGFIIAAVFVLLLSLSQLYLTVMLIPRFAEIFRDKLGGRPLPLLTTTVLNGRWVLAGLACVCLIFTALVVQRKASFHYLLVLLAFLLLQIAFTTIGLFLPLIVDMQVITPTQ